MAGKGQDVFSRRTFCLVTGASKGFGKSLASIFASKFPKGSAVILLARSLGLLKQTKQEIEHESPHVTVKVVEMDLAHPNENKFTDCLAGILADLGKSATDYEQALVVHNAASLGDVSKKFSEIDNTEECQAYFSLNLTAVTSLNSRFLACFQETACRFVINISSICAIQPFKSWSMYCAGKAARDMFFRTMALEDPEIRVLNYAPGPLDTEMQVVARTETADKELKVMFKDMHSDGKLLSCDVSVAKLVGLLQANTFDSGAHIDYYDI